jgi:hypothetical protein
LIEYREQEGVADITKTLGMNNWIVVPRGRLMLVLNAKLYLLNEPAVGESTDETIDEVN